MTPEYFDINVCGVERRLPVVRVADDTCIASFVLLGDAEMAAAAAEGLIKEIPEVDCLITAEAKGIPLVQEMAHKLGMPRYFVARKSVKPYMVDPFVTEVYSITTQTKQVLCLDHEEAAQLKGKRVLIVDDVISSGESLKAMEKLVKKAGGIIAGKAAVLAEGEAAGRKDIIYLETIPVFAVEKSR